MVGVAIRAERLKNRFGGLTAVAGLDFAVERGEVRIARAKRFGQDDDSPYDRRLGGADIRKRGPVRAGSAPPAAGRRRCGGSCPCAPRVGRCS